ncbi:WD40 repeat domain-containing protein [Methylorubrum sp. POS3]|uniref:WD40 repeat domain-containing protein n=1 Tax=Methylorubrum sp. POS3 TaxID=2998492 RepID=UPI00372666DB
MFAVGMPISEVQAQGVVAVFSPDGSRVASSSYGVWAETDNALRLWEIGTGQLIRTFEGHKGRVTSVAFSPDGNHVLSGSEDKTLRLWETDTGRFIRSFEGHQDGVNAVAFSKDGRRVLSGDGDGKLRLWEANTGQLLQAIEGHELAILSVAFSPDGRRLLSGGDEALKLWDADTGKLIRTFEVGEGTAFSVAFSPDGQRVLAGSTEKAFRLWDAATGRLIRSFEVPQDTVYSAAFSPDGQRILAIAADSGASGGMLRLSETDTGRLLWSAKIEQMPWSVTLSPDGRRAVSGTYEKSIRLWAADTGQPILDFQTGPVQRKVPQIKGPIIAAGWELLGIKTHFQYGHPIGYVFIKADTDNQNAALGSAILVAKRLIDAQKLDIAKVFVMHPAYRPEVLDNRAPIARADYISSRWKQINSISQEKAWLLQRGFEDYTHLDSTFDLNVTSSPRFLDAVSEFERYCPLTGNCQYGMDGW